MWFGRKVQLDMKYPLCSAKTFVKINNQPEIAEMH